LRQAAQVTDNKGAFMDFLLPHLEAYLAVIRKYAVFEGRARRKEFWMFALYNFIIGAVLGILDTIPIIGWAFRIASGLFSLAIFIPSIALGTRRLHDTNRTGWLQLLLLLSIIPSIGAIVLIFYWTPWLLIFRILIAMGGLAILIVFWVQAGNSGENKYGSDPKAGGSGTRKSAASSTAKSSTSKKDDEKGSTVFCGECGAKNAKGTKFCGSCGKKLK
jgi:uncharacterized membrane protein YhaH (DUF805 family)